MKRMYSIAYAVRRSSPRRATSQCRRVDRLTPRMSTRTEPLVSDVTMEAR